MVGQYAEVLTVQAPSFLQHAPPGQGFVGEQTVPPASGVAFMHAQATLTVQSALVLPQHAPGCGQDTPVQVVVAYWNWPAGAVAQAPAVPKVQEPSRRQHAPVSESTTYVSPPAK